MPPEMSKHSFISSTRQSNVQFPLLLRQENMKKHYHQKIMTAHFKKNTSILFLLGSITLLSALTVSAEKLKGKVNDAFTNEELIGATITLTNETKKFYDLTGLDGSFYFKDVPSGAYTVTVSYIGYQTYSKEIEIVAGENLLPVALTTASHNLAEVEVVGILDNESDQFARRSELKAANIVNIVSAKTMEVSPDITIGNVLQRVSGVSMTRTGSGDGQYAIIRGLPNRYTYTSLNGIILPSPDAQTRSIPLDMFPANMMERVEIAKSLTPNVEGNAIGGAANLVIKNAPDQLTINGTLSTGVSTLFSDRPFSGFNNSGMNFKSPAEINGNGYAAKLSDFSVNHLNFKNVSLPLNLVTNFSIGNRIINHKLGYLIGGSYIREYRGSNTLLYNGGQVTALTNPDAALTENKVDYITVQNRENSSLQSRLGVMGKLDYTFSSKHVLKLSGLILQLDDNLHRYYIQNGLSNGGEIDYFDRVLFVRKNISNVTLSGNHSVLNNLNVDWTASYAEASSQRPDWSDFGRFKFEKANPSEEITYVSNTFTHQWQHSDDQDKSGYLNFKYIPVKNIELSAGGMYRSKERSAYYNQYKISPAYVNLLIQQYTDINSVVFGSIANPYSDSTNANNYRGTETVSALYAMAKINAFRDKLEILGGVRQETTNQNYYSQLSKALPNKDGIHKYTDVLPSLNLKYKLSQSQNLRISYFSGISRPNLYELVPAGVSGDTYSDSGNPYLKHTTSQNYDLRYEHFFSTSNYIVGGAFYKNLPNPIEVAFGPLNGPNASTLLPTNPDKPAKVYGFELLFSKFIRNFGISGNYTYIHSEVTTLKLISGTNIPGKPAGINSQFPEETRPMQGQANNIANLSLMYKDLKAGLNLQLSYIYTGDRISVISQYYGLDVWQRANSQLDFSLNKTFITKYTFFLKATNLLNTNLYQDVRAANSRIQDGLVGQDNQDRVLIQRDVFKQSILAGVRFSL